MGIKKEGEALRKNKKAVPTFWKKDGRRCRVETSILHFEKEKM
ncbi:uncharacterized protein G2W53_033058 [Senna tora]|uniref:Uncharacterized protein n=1 Tax=Senna tora TaxID=362788 RepID=A0A834SZE1_9FABA|nr:uncharacterized protein G2W53_033058 [Senna tora]